MNIREQLLVEHSKDNTDRIRKYIGVDKDKLQELMDCFFSNTYRVSQRSAMVVSSVFDHTPQMINPYVLSLIDGLAEPNQHIAIKRNALRILQSVPIPEEKTTVLFDHCLENLIQKNEPVAVKAFSMTVMLQICKSFPELKKEVIPVLEIELERNESAGVLNRGKKVLLALHKLK
jgi:hypothetical protein